jgi:hypothetical protein
LAQPRFRGGCLPAPVHAAVRDPSGMGKAGVGAWAAGAEASEGEWVE